MIYIDVKPPVQGLLDVNQNRAKAAPAANRAQLSFTVASLWGRFCQ